ncbi:MAG: radical SAM protein [Candidatus Wallbacteria bacterium]|nr:radical SAM protein [Candidatus Wallbacteria bacterium]
MHIVFVYAAYENLGIEYLSAVLKRAGHRVSLAYSPLIFRDSLVNSSSLGVFFNRDAFMIHKIVALKPDLVAFPAVTDWFRWMYRIAEKVKSRMPSVPVIFGGIHPSTAPEFLISQPAIDYICLGEGEDALLELVTTLESGGDPSGIANIWGKFFRNAPRPLIKNLDCLPFPDHELFYEKVPYFKSVYTILGSRGCPYSCTYCCNNCLRKLYAGDEPFFRKRSVANIISELKYALEKWRFKSVLIEDDLFTGDTGRIRDFCEQYKAWIRKPFVCVTHPLAVHKEELDMLKDAGCIQIEIGVQTMNEKVRKKHLDRHETNPDIVNALRTLHESGIPFNIDHIVGLPDDTFEWQLFALRLYNEVRPNRLLFFHITCYPRTDIAGTFEQRGRLSDDLKQKILEGRSESDEQHGSIEDQELQKNLDQLRFIFGWLPVLPKRLVRRLMKPEQLSRLPRSPLLCKVLPVLYSILKGHEPRGMTILKKYLYHVLRMGF